MDALINSLASNYGLTGIFIATLLLYAGTVSVLLLKEKDKRIDDAIKYKTDLVNPIKETGEAIKEVGSVVRAILYRGSNGDGDKHNGA